jgi:hypothetical protein
MKHTQYLRAWLIGFFGGIGLTVFIISVYCLFNLFSEAKPPCHCHYRTTDDRFREGYTKANKPCEPQPNGHVKIGQTTYTNITEYRCE